MTHFFCILQSFVNNAQDNNSLSKVQLQLLFMACLIYFSVSFELKFIYENVNIVKYNCKIYV